MNLWRSRSFLLAHSLVSGCPRLSRDYLNIHSYFEYLLTALTPTCSSWRPIHLNSPFSHFGLKGVSKAKWNPEGSVFYGVEDAWSPWKRCVSPASRTLWTRRTGACTSRRWTLPSVWRDQGTAWTGSQSPTSPRLQVRPSRWTSSSLCGKPDRYCHYYFEYSLTVLTPTCSSWPIHLNSPFSHFGLKGRNQRQSNCQLWNVIKGSLVWLLVVILIIH